MDGSMNYINALNRPIDPSDPSVMQSPQMAPLLEALQRGGYANAGAMPGGQGWEGVGQRLAWMGDKRRAGRDNAELDRVAQQMGYRNYAEWQNWQRQQDQMKQLPNPEAGGSEGGLGWLGRLIGWHPANTLGYTHKKMEEAKGARR